MADDGSFAQYPIDEECDGYVNKVSLNGVVTSVSQFYGDDGEMLLVLRLDTDCSEEKTSDPHTVTFLGPEPQLVEQAYLSEGKNASVSARVFWERHRPTANSVIIGERIESVDDPADAESGQPTSSNAVWLTGDLVDVTVGRADQPYIPPVVVLRVGIRYPSRGEPLIQRVDFFRLPPVMFEEAMRALHSTASPKVYVRGRMRTDIFYQRLDKKNPRTGNRMLGERYVTMVEGMWFLFPDAEGRM